MDRKIVLNQTSLLRGSVCAETGSLWGRCHLQPPLFWSSDRIQTLEMSMYYAVVCVLVHSVKDMDQHPAPHVSLQCFRFTYYRHSSLFAVLLPLSPSEPLHLSLLTSFSNHLSEGHFHQLIATSISTSTTGSYMILSFLKMNYLISLVLGKRKQAEEDILQKCLQKPLFKGILKTFWWRVEEKICANMCF